MRNRLFPCTAKSLSKLIIPAVFFITSLHIAPVSFADENQTSLHSITASNANDVTKGRPLLTNWNSEHRPANLGEWPQDKQITYINNQEQARTLIQQLRQQKCSNIPCLVAQDCAQQLYEKSKERKNLQARDRDYIRTNAQGVALTSVGLGVIFTSIGIATANPGLIVAGIFINATHFAANQLLTQPALSAMDDDTQRTEAILAVEKEALIPILDKLDTARRWAAEAREIILYNMALEHDGHIVHPVPEGLRALLADNILHSQEAPVKVRRENLADTLTESLEVLPENAVFALFFKAETQLAFKGVHYKNQFYLMIPHPANDLVIGFTQPTQLLAFFSDMANNYKVDHVELLVPTS